jgi:hypothetical protein
MSTNLTTKVEGKTLVIRVDLSKPGTPSKSGKSLVVATTGGFLDIGDGVKLGLNVVRSL